MPIDERWYGLGDFVRLMKLDRIEFREYQFNVIKSVLKNGNTLVVLPTGLGKTIIGVAVIASALAEGKKALILAPTKPLAEQHYVSLTSMLNIEKEDIALLLGSVAKKQRAETEQSARVIVATPQTIANDLKSGSFSLENFSVAVFDECHRAVGKYAYTYIANELAVRGSLIVGLTASPGSKKEKINKLIGTLNIRHIEARISTDADVVKYVMPKSVHIVRVPQTDLIRRIAVLIRPIGDESLASLNKLGLFSMKNFESVPKGRIIQLGHTIDKISAQGFKFGALYSYSKLLNISHAYDLLLTEGLYPFHAYMDALAHKEKRSRAVESILANKGAIEAMRLASEAIKRGEEHPKAHEVIKTLLANPGKSAILFVQYRSTIKMLVDVLRANGISATAFVGKKEGVTQDMQKAVLSDFRAGKFRVLVASSIGEEGLDIPSVDLVVFYEPIPNEIRNIQRKGRTGRFRAGDIYILVTQGTKDEVYLYISAIREKRMLALIEDINRGLGKEKRFEDDLGLGQKRLE